MPSDLSQFIAQARICDTHEHLCKQPYWDNDKPDILRELWESYAASDLVVAGASPESVTKLQDSSEPDIEKRFGPVKHAWEAAQYTGYGEALKLTARRYFGIEQIDGPSLAAAQAKLPKRWLSVDRLRIMQEDGGLDHIQVDDFSWPCLPDSGAPEFFLYDLSWLDFCSGNIKAEALYQETGIDVKNIATLREAMHSIFAKYGPCAIAVKTQHAYNRTLAWQERSDAEAAQALELALIQPKRRSVEQTNCLGDWCCAQGVELAAKHNLPFKIHTGTLAGWAQMQVDRINAGLLCPLLAKYPAARFVLMHIAYPYDDELVAIAKHYPNVWVDLCWAWSVNPSRSMQFVRHFIHGAPANKLFGFGGDSLRPRVAVGYAMQARKWLTRTLESEVNEGDLSEAHAMEIAARLLYKNQRECFDIDGARKAIRTKLNMTMAVA